MPVLARRPHPRMLPPWGALLALLAAAPAGAVQVPTDFVNETIVNTLDEPRGFAFLPDGRVLVIEQRTGKVRMIVNGAIATTDPVLTVPSLNAAGFEQGLQGIAVDPAWPTRPYVYLFHNRTGGFCRLVRYTASGSLSDPNSGTLSLSTPLLLIDDILDETIYHQAGCLRFGPDSMLYVTTGDDANDCQVYNLGNFYGKLLRLKVDGLGPGGGGPVSRASITPPDNPFNAMADPEAKLVWAWGLRNPWGFQIDRVTGTIYGVDVGDDDFEEVNEIHAGDFMGWPYREGTLIRVRPECPEPGGAGSLASVAPIDEYAHGLDSYAVFSGGMYRPAVGGTENWPDEYYPDRGNVFYGDYFAGELRRLTWNGSSWVRAAPVPGQPNDSSWATGLVTAVDFLVGPEGSLWWLAQYDEFFGASTGNLNRIRYTGVTAVAPGRTEAGGLRASPNPFSTGVELSFPVGGNEHVRLRIFDLAGREVRSLLDGRHSGEVRVRWDGTTSTGARAPAGVYFARLDRPDAGVTRTLRLMLGR